MPFASLLQSYVRDESAKSAFSDAQNNISDRTGHWDQEKKIKKRKNKNSKHDTVRVQKLCVSVQLSVHNKLLLSKQMENVPVQLIYKDINMMLHLLKTLFLWSWVAPVPEIWETKYKRNNREENTPL